MATETAAPDHTSTDKQFENKVEEEANGHESVSLLNENVEKHDTAEYAQGQAIPSSKTKEEAERYEKTAEGAVVEAEKSEDSPAVEASVEDNLKHDKVEDAQGPAAPSSNTERDEQEAEPAVAAVETIDGSPSSDALVSDNLKEKKEPIPDTQTVSVTEPRPEAAKSMLKEEEEEQPKTAEIPELSVETVGKLSSTAETNPLTESESESEAEAVKETEYLEASSQDADKPEPAVTKVHGKAEEPDKESQDKVQEADQPNAVVISDPSAEINDKPHDGIEKPEPIITEVQEKSEEQEKESQEKAQEVEQPDTVAVSDPSAETNEKQSDTTESSEPVDTEVREKLQEPEKRREAEKPNTVEVSDSDPSAEANEKPSDAIHNPEPLVTEEIETNSQEKSQDAGQPTIVATPASSAETSEKLSDAAKEMTTEPEFDAKISKEINNYEARPTETEKAEPVAAETTEKTGESEKQSFEKKEEEQHKTFIHQTESESADKSGDKMEVQPSQESDVEAVKETGNTNLEAVPVKEEKPALVEGKEASDEIIKEPIPLTEEKTEVEETSITGNSAQLSLNEETQAVTENLLQPSPEVAGKAVKEACTNEIQEKSKEVDGVSNLKDPEQASTNQEAKTELKEQREHSAPINVEEKIAANDDKKQAGATEESSREEAEVEEQNEAKTATTEARDVKTQNATDERAQAVLDYEKQRQPEIKVDEGATVVTEQVRETLASKSEQKGQESVKTGVDNTGRVQIEKPVKSEVQTPGPPTEGSDATKTSKDIPKATPAKPAQKQSNHILSKVKQSLVKAKKAIIGKSPTSKTVSSEAKGDIKVESNHEMR